MGTVAGLLVPVLRELFLRVNVDADALFAEVGLDLRVGPDVRVPAEAFDRLFELAPGRLGDEAFGLHVAEALESGDFGLLELLVRSAPNAKEALERFIAYYPVLLRETVDLSLVSDGDVARILHRRAPPLPQSRQEAELLMACIALRACAMTNTPFPLREVRFIHARPADIAEHERIFRANVVFGAERNSLVFDATFLDVPLITSDAMVSEITRKYADLLMRDIAVGDPFVDGIKRTIAETLREEPSAAMVAKKVGVTPRTLQRRLKAQGTTLTDIVDDVRRELAERYLTQSDVGLSEIAYLLGFAEPSAFHRAFKRWTGRRPGEYRAKLR